MGEKCLYEIQYAIFIGDTDRRKHFTLGGKTNIVGGGVKATVGFVWKMAKGISWIGWFLVPFPMDIITGIASFFIVLMFIPFVLLCVPLLGVAANYHQTSMDHQAAEKYLSYCTPVATATETTAE